MAIWTSGNEGGRLATRDLKALGLPDASMTGNWVDFDNDGAMDLHLIPQGLYRQTGTGRFERTGVLAVDAEAYRAAICNWFDVDNDGRLDVLMALDENPAKDKVAGRRSTWKVSASRNVGAANNWLQLNLVGVDGNRQAIGARVTVVTAARQQIQEVGASEGSFFSQGHYRLYFGLGGHEHADTVRVRWSNGSETELRSVVGGRIVTVEQKGPEASSPAAMVPSQLQGSR